MITILSGTNRLNSRTLHVAHVYAQLIQAQGYEAQICSLTQMKSIVRDEPFVRMEQQYLLPVHKFVFIVPEYNGSIPGIFKLMLDLSDTRNCWYNKKVLLTGVADGRAGNLRGLDHLTNILNYMHMHVFYNKIPLSRINQEMDTEGKMLLSETLETIKNQIGEFLNW